MNVSGPVIKGTADSLGMDIASNTKLFRFKGYS
jgi:hypothetical protein